VDVDQIDLKTNSSLNQNRKSNPVREENGFAIDLIG
jgi:hypothetical protein